MSGPVYWVWGAGPKMPSAKREAERIVQIPQGSIDQAWKLYRDGTLANPPISDLAPGASERLRRRISSAPEPSLFFGARNLREMCGGLVARTRERGQLASKVVFEDHGLVGPGERPEVMLFFGQDAVSTRTLARHRPALETLRGALAPDAAIYLVHCYAASDGGRLIQNLSRIIGVPVYGADALQYVGNQALDGGGYRADANNIRFVKSFPESVLHFD
ncbi:MAG: DUF4347 domain-containing protein [Nannocystaceae bacterium]|nr:DUF4347 domain-containing protein [Nannocystaceae bacterium]